MENKTKKPKKTKAEKKEQQKQELLEKFNNLKKEFLEIEQNITKNFILFSLNEIVALKSVLEQVELNMKSFARKLKRYHKVNINLEDRNFLNKAS